MVRLTLQNTIRHRSTTLTALTALSALSILVGCGSPTGTPPSSTEETDEGRTPKSLCSLPQFSPKATVPLDKEKFIATLADYSLSWMTPFHNALLEIDELKVFETWIEGVRGTYDQVCREPADWEFLPPDDALTNEMKRAQYKRDIEDFLAQSVEVESGARLRLSFQDCMTCGQKVGAAPLFLNATLDETGLLSISVELTEGTEWTKQVFISEKSVGAVAPLAALSKWGETANDDLRAGRVFFPQMNGSAVIQAKRDDDGHMTASFGLLDFSFVGDPGGQNETSVASSSKCIGLSATLGPKSEGSSANFFAGETDVTMTGHTHCPNQTSCSEIERAGSFAYHLGGSNVTLSQVATGGHYDTTVDVAFSSEASAAVNGEIFARGGLGADGQGGNVKIGANREEDSFLLAFEPKLDMAGAMILSKFSEQTRMQWPDTLQDEIFDLTFGGDEVGTIRIPYRELCPDGVYPRPQVARREVEIVSGSGTLSVGGGRVLEASSGQCVGRSLGDPNTFTLTSDYWDAGFACSK